MKCICAERGRSRQLPVRYAARYCGECKSTYDYKNWARHMQSHRRNQGRPARGRPRTAARLPETSAPVRSSAGGRRMHAYPSRAKMEAGVRVCVSRLYPFVCLGVPVHTLDFVARQAAPTLHAHIRDACVSTMQATVRRIRGELGSAAPVLTTTHVARTPRHLKPSGNTVTEPEATSDQGMDVDILIHAPDDIDDPPPAQQTRDLENLRQRFTIKKRSGRAIQRNEVPTLLPNEDAPNRARETSTAENRHSHDRDHRSEYRETPVQQSSAKEAPHRACTSTVVRATEGQTSAITRHSEHRETSARQSSTKDASNQARDRTSREISTAEHQQSRDRDHRSEYRETPVQQSSAKGAPHRACTTPVVRSTPGETSAVKRHSERREIPARQSSVKGASNRPERHRSPRHRSPRDEDQRRRDHRRSPSEDIRRITAVVLEVLARQEPR